MSNANLVERRVRCVVYGVDRGGRDITAVAIAKVLVDNSIEVVSVDEIPSKSCKALVPPFWSEESPPVENTSHGPQRKGRGGKFRRW